jgi:protein-S-isoprenylcysteine O-methyltransferase Ste14
MNRGLLIRGLLMVGLLAFLLLLLAGRTSYWQAWVFGAVNAVLVVTLSVLLADQSNLIRDRMKPGEHTKPWDRVLMMVFFPLSAGVVVFAALDGGRLGWSPTIPVWVYPIAYVVYAVSAYLHLWAISSNEFYTSTVSIDPAGSHVVVDVGPYGYVRHPGYTGIMFMEVGIAIVLGSLWALIPAVAVALLLVIRGRLEDTALLRELPGYAEYAERVKYRLLPRIW